MRHFQDRTSAEIGEALGIPAATVRTQLRMAMKKLRKLYRRQEA
jgi:DNA-directed RNA polymerase specialized sigma24 family protein